MAENLYETDERERKAWRRVVAAARKLAKQIGNNALGEAVANAQHNDTSTRDMRRSEALATLLEALVVSDEAEDKSKDDKSKNKAAG